MTSRRDYLAVLGAALAGTAGCLSGNDGGTGGGTDTPTDGGTGTASPTPTSSTTEPPTTNRTTDGIAGDLTVSNVAVYEAVTYYAWPGSTQVVAPTDDQFVVATVEGPADEPAPAFVFEAGDATWEQELVGQQYAPDAELEGRGGGPVAGDADATGYIAFQVPSPLTGAEPQIVLPAGDQTWAVPDSERGRLRTPSPTFALSSLDVPEDVTDVDEFTVDLTVENTSDVDGRFLAAVTWPTGYADDDESHVLEDDVAAGETASFSLALNPSAPSPDDGTVTLSVHGHVAAERTVRVAE